MTFRAIMKLKQMEVFTLWSLGFQNFICNFNNSLEELHVSEIKALIPYFRWTVKLKLLHPMYTLRIKLKSSRIMLLLIYRTNKFLAKLNQSLIVRKKSRLVFHSLWNEVLTHLKIWLNAINMEIKVLKLIRKKLLIYLTT